MTQRFILPPGFIHNARLTFGSVSTVTVGTGGLESIMLDSKNTQTLRFIGTLTADITTGGAGGLDTGSEAADTWYAVHVIADFTGGAGAVALLLSLSATAPTLPSGYSRFRRVGWVRNDGSSNFQDFEQTGNGRERSYFWDVDESNIQKLAGGNATSFTNVDLSDCVPSTAKDVILRAIFAGGASSLREARLRIDGSTEADPPQKMAQEDNKGRPYHFEMASNGSQVIEYEVDNAADSLDLFVTGFREEL